MKGKTIARFVWSASVVAAAILVSFAITRDRVHTGSDLKFATNEKFYLEVSGEANIQAASSEFFLFRKETGETLVGLPTEPPLGWDSEKYYVVGPVKIQGGQWLVEGNDISVHIFTDGNINVTEVVADKGGIVFVFMVATIIIWCLVMLLLF